MRNPESRSGQPRADTSHVRTTTGSEREEGNEVRTYSAKSGVDK